LKEPREPLPYLFLYSKEQNTGKTIFHESIGLLITTGVMRADHALISSQGFNGELENCVVAVIEETDLKKEKAAINRIKDWTTSKTISIHRKNQTPYSVINTCKFIQCSNDSSACPVLPGDSRIVVIKVDPLDPQELIPKTQLLQQLEKEAPDFLASILAIELPESGDRLNVPVITTTAKLSAQESHMSLLEEFLNEECYQAPGQYITLADLFDRFVNWMEPGEVHNWTKHKLGKEIMTTRFIKGRNVKDNQVIIGNISFTKPEENQLNNPKFVLINGFLRIEK
jgi:phage/plasmid-associated DNA primase